MRSASERRPDRGRRRLASRVVLATIASGALGGVLAAVTTVVAVDRLVANRGDLRLSGATRILEGEILEDFEEGEWEPLAEVVDDENGELVTSGIRLAVFSDGHRIAGDPWVPELAPGACESRGPLGRRIRACGLRYQDWVLVAASASDTPELRAIYAIASFGALAFGGLIAALAGARLTRWALHPLTDLERSIRRMRGEAPDVGRMLAAESEETCAEVALVREALAELLGRIQALLEPARRFAADAAHELRSPLTALRAELDLMVEDAGDASSRQALSRVAARVRQLSDLVDRLLVLASPIDEEHASRETVALADVVDDSVSNLPAAERGRVRVDCRSEGLTRGEATLLTAMVRNALDNALKYSDGPVDISVEERDRVLVRIRDRGPGIGTELRERVFEPFFRLANQGAPGVGLGLSLIGHIVRAHAGTASFVDVDDAEGGACLCLQLPRWRPLDAAPNQI